MYTECWGEYKADCLVITKSVLAAEFKNWGNVSLQKVLADLIQQNKIIPYHDKAKKSPRKVWNTTINGINNVPAVKIKLAALVDDTAE